MATMATTPGEALGTQGRFPDSLAGIGAFFVAGLDVARGLQTIGLANIVGMAFCALVVIIGVKEIVSR
jgi:hypothetical protein